MVPDPHSARDGSGVTTCPGEGALSQTAGGPGPPTRSRTPTYYPDPSAGREQAPRQGGVRNRHVSAGAGTRTTATLPREDSLTYHIQCGRRRCALCHSRARGDSYQAVPLTARYRDAWCRLHRHPRHARQTAMPVRRDSSATEYHNACTVDPAVYAATYTTSNGRLADGTGGTPSVRESTGR